VSAPVTTTASGPGNGNAAAGSCHDFVALNKKLLQIDLNFIKNKTKCDKRVWVTQTVLKRRRFKRPD
jgi:hypothetical protein